MGTTVGSGVCVCMTTAGSRRLRPPLARAIRTPEIGNPCRDANAPLARARAAAFYSCLVCLRPLGLCMLASNLCLYSLVVLFLPRPRSAGGKASNPNPLVTLQLRAA